MRDARLERGFSFVVGIVAMLAMRPLVGVAPPPRAIVAQRVPVAIPVAVPRVEPVLLPTIVAAVAPAPLDCPTPPRTDDAPIGRPIAIGEMSTYEAPTTRIAASARAPVIALLGNDGHVRVSDDDGRSFRAAFGDAHAGAIAVDDRGRVYATIDGALGVRDERGRERDLERLPCEDDDCTDAIATAGDAVVWMRSHTVHVSRDGGRRWRTLAGADGAELATRRHVIALGGALYGIEHVSDMCGWEADTVAKIDLASGASTSTTFDNDVRSPVLDVTDDAGATWAYRARRTRAARELLLGRLAPAAGGRVLFANEHQLDELCGTHARAIAMSYGADRVDAVDAAGRALIAVGDRVFRFSPRWGWRELDPQRVSPSDTP